MQMQKQNVPFTMVPNELLNSPSISLKAKGMYSYMFSKPHNWNFTIRSISSQIPEGVDSISNSINELKTYVWLEYEKLSSGKGIYTLVFEPNSENPNQGNPNKEKPVCISNKDITNNKDKYTTTTILVKIKFEKAHEIFMTMFTNLKMEDFKYEFEKFKVLNEDVKRTEKNWKRWCLQLKKFNKQWGR